VAAAGSFVEDAGSFIVQASGLDIWGARDEFHFVYRALSGDGEIIARVTGLSNTNNWAKAGVMIRENLNDDSRHAMMALTVGNGAAFQRRTTAAASSSHTAGPGVVPHWVRLVRSGSVFTGFVSVDGVSWAQVGSTSITMASEVSIGLAVTSHNDGTLNTAVFDSVSIQ